MAIEDIIKKIKDDAQKQADAIIADAKHKRKEMVELAKKKAQDEAVKVIESAKEDATKQKQRLIASASMGLRLEILREKQSALEEAFIRSNEVLVAIGAPSYRQLIKSMILRSAQTGNEEIVISKHEERLDNGFIEQINKEKNWKLKLAKADLENKGGFILKGDKMMINNTFDALLKQLKPRLEKEIAEALFK